MLKTVQVLRAMAALLVVCDHINYIFSRSDPYSRTCFFTFGFFGSIGVDVFFAISGFIMVSTSWDSFGVPGISRHFLLRRMARIYPPYWFVMIPTVLAYVFASHHIMRAHSGRADIVSSLLLLPQQNVPLLLVSWTLSFEMFFYFVFALVLNVRRTLLVPVLLIWLVLEVALALILKDSTDPYRRFLAMPFPIEFIMGAFIGRLYRLGKMPKGSAIGLAGLCAAFTLWTFGAAHGLSASATTTDFTRIILFGIPAAMILYGVVARDLYRRASIPSWLVSTGDSSYAIYLWHLPVIAVAGSLAAFAGVRGFWAESAVELTAIFVVVAVSFVEYRFFERPVTASLNVKIERLPVLFARKAILWAANVRSDVAGTK